MNNFDSQHIFKFCKFCGEKISEDAIICIKCGRQVEELKTSNQQPNIIINNDNSSKNVNTNTNVNNNRMGMHHGNPKNKTIAIILCVLLGYFGVHKFYEGKTIMGIIYFFTLGFCLIGVIIDFFVLLSKPSIYYV